jgi:hypothetical protein
LTAVNIYKFSSGTVLVFANPCRFVTNNSIPMLNRKGHNDTSSSNCGMSQDPPFSSLHPATAKSYFKVGC